MERPKHVICDLSGQLKCEKEFADRFVYSAYFVPRMISSRVDAKTPDLTLSQKVTLQNVVAENPTAFLADEKSEVLNEILTRNGMDLDELRNIANLSIETKTLQETTKLDSEKKKQADIETKSITKEDLKDETGVRKADLGLREPSEGSSGIINDVVEFEPRISKKRAEVNENVDKKENAENDVRVRAEWHALRSMESPSFTDLATRIVVPEVGFVFLDRTRMRPTGYAIGEHLYTLPLAPGEEVTLEQKTFSKRQTTMEEQTEKEEQFDIELSSTLTTELQEGFERQKSITDKWGLSLSHTGAYKSPEFFWGQFNASHTISYTNDVTKASQETIRRSTKDSQTASSRVAAKYRTLHKVNFKVSTEQGFESSSRRLVKNPNKFTPINLHYFKVMKTFEMSHERYGVRLCWAPFVKKPAETLFARIRVGRKAILDKSQAAIPERPTKPTKVTAGQPVEEVVEVVSSPVPADKWGVTGDMSAEYTLTLPIPSGFTLSDIPGVIVLSRNISRSHDANIVGQPWAEEGQLKATVHVGVASVWDLPNPGADAGRNSQIDLQIKATFKRTLETVAEDAAYKDALVQYFTRLKDWEQKVIDLQTAAQAKADAWEDQLMRDFNPVMELLARLIKTKFPTKTRDEGAELAFWQRVFQWDAASYELYSGTWSDSPARDATRDPSHFVNASWARLYLPVRVGLETDALRWIFGRIMDGKPDGTREKMFATLIAELNEFREKNFGADEIVMEHGDCPTITEKVMCLGKWKEVMPTDGAHIEVAQSGTSAADIHSISDMEDAVKLREAVTSNHEQNANLKEKVIEKMAEGVQARVVIGADGAQEFKL